MTLVSLIYHHNFTEKKIGCYCPNVRENMYACLPYVFACVLLNQQTTSN